MCTLPASRSRSPRAPQCSRTHSVPARSSLSIRWLCEAPVQDEPSTPPGPTREVACDLQWEITALLERIECVFEQEKSPRLGQRVGEFTKAQSNWDVKFK